MVKVCLGGTFDIIHRGHEVLLNKALDAGDSIIIGLTTDARAKKGRENEDINSYSQREISLYNWLKSKNAEKRVSIVPLDDDWGPGALEEDINSIVVSEETKSVAKKLNTQDYIFMHTCLHMTMCKQIEHMESYVHAYLFTYDHV